MGMIGLSERAHLIEIGFVLFIVLIFSSNRGMELSHAIYTIC